MSRDRRTGPADAGKGSPGASKHSAQLWALSRPSPPGSLLWLPQPAQIQNHRHPGMLEAKGSLEITAQVPPTQMAGVLKRKGKSGHRDMKRRRWWEDRTHRVSSCDERGRQGDASTSRGHQRLQRPAEARKEARRFPFRTSRISDFQPPELWGNKLQLCWATLFFFFVFDFLICKFIFNWRIIALQYRVGFCQTSTWISHRYTYVSSLLNLPPHATPLGCSVQSLSRVPLFATPWIAARQASLFITNSQSSLRLTSIESVMPSSHVILCRPLLLLPPIPPSIRVLSNESTLRVRWPKYWSFSFSISPSKEHPGLILLQNPNLSSESYSKFTLSHLICSNLL